MKRLIPFLISFFLLMGCQIPFDEGGDFEDTLKEREQEQDEYEENNDDNDNDNDDDDDD